MYSMGGNCNLLSRYAKNFICSRIDHVKNMYTKSYSVHIDIMLSIRNLILEMGLLLTIFGIFTSKKKLSKDFINCHPYTLFSSPEPKAHKVNL